MISTLENQTRDRPLAVPRCLPQQGWPGWPCPRATAGPSWGEVPHFTPALSPPSLGASPGSRPGSAPWLCAAPSPLSGARHSEQRCF